MAEKNVNDNCRDACSRSDSDPEQKNAEDDDVLIALKQQID